MPWGGLGAAWGGHCFDWMNSVPRFVHLVRNEGCVHNFLLWPFVRARMLVVQSVGIPLTIRLRGSLVEVATN